MSPRPRWVRKNGASDYARSEGCPCCGSMRGRGPCEVSVCRACGSHVCHSYGGANGSCPVCLFGLILGWSGAETMPCGYKGCADKAVARAPRVGACCARHLGKASVSLPRGRVTLAEYVAEQLRQRSARFVEVSP